MESTFIFIGCIALCSWHVLFGSARAEMHSGLSARRRGGPYATHDESSGSAPFIAVGLVGALASGFVWLVGGASPATVIGTALLFVGITYVIGHLYWDSVRESEPSREPQPDAKRRLAADLGAVVRLFLDILLWA